MLKERQCPVKEEGKREEDVKRGDALTLCRSSRRKKKGRETERGTTHLSHTEERRTINLEKKKKKKVERERCLPGPREKENKKSNIPKKEKSVSGLLP